MSANPPTPSTSTNRLVQGILLVIGTVVTILGQWGLHLSTSVVAGVDAIVVAGIPWIEAMIIHGQHKVAAAQVASPDQTRVGV